MRALRFIILPLIVTLVACAKQSENVEDQATQVKPTAFEGNWSLGCQADASPMSLLPGGQIENFYVIEGQTYILIQRGYSAPPQGEPGCQANRLAYTLQESGVFGLKKSVAGLMLSDDWDNWSNGNWGTFQTLGRRFTLTPNNPATVMTFTANKVCGVEEWNIGKSVGVTNKKCFGVKLYSSKSETWAIRYDVAEDKQIYMNFGTLSDNSSDPSFDPALRYKRLSTLPFSFKNPDKDNGNLIKGKQGNQ